MPRDSGGLYSLPPGNPVVPFTTIESDWANPTMSDVGQSLTDSLSRSGKGGMLSSLRGLDGSAAVPAWSWTNEPSTGRYRAGPGQVVESVLGQPVVRYLASGLEQWDQDTMSWIPLTPRDALGTPFDPAPSNLTSTNVQDAIEEVNDKTGGTITADSISYDDTNVYFPATTVQQAIDRIGADIPGLANDILDNSDAILIVEGDLILLTNRVTQVEITANTNTNDIALNTQQITANTTDINTERGRIDTNVLDIATNASGIQQNTDYIDFVDGKVDANTADITTNFQTLVAHDARITTAQNGVDTNYQSLLTHYDYMWGPGGFNDRIIDNDSDISDNASAINTIENRFPGGVLTTFYGGTGVQTSTGSGNNVLHSGATMWNADLQGAPLAPTQSSGNNTTRVATTAFVTAAINAIPPSGGGGGNAQLVEGTTSNGQWFGIRDADTPSRWVVIQWGSRSVGSNTTVTLPYNMGSSSAYDATLTRLSAGEAGVAVTSKSSASFQASISGTSTVGWHALGYLPASLLAYVETGDRYYNKVTRTEHSQQISGPWDDDPNVVILPPGNTFWGPPLDPDEVLTYDIDNLPLGRVPRVVPLEESLSILLQAAGVTRAAMDRAIYLDGRGIPGPLNAIDSALDALVISESETLETLVGLV